MNARPITIEPDEAARLCALAKGGDKEAVETLISAYMSMIVKVATRMDYVPNDIEDRVQEGVVGFMVAINHYDPKKGRGLGQYAKNWIRKSILQSGSQSNQVIRLPEDLFYRQLKIGKVSAELEQRLEREPTAAEIASEMGISVRVVKNCKKFEFTRIAESLATLESGNEDPSEQLVKAEIAGLLHTAMGTLDAEEAEVLTLRFGLNGEKSLTVPETEVRTGFSNHKVRALQARSMAKLREKLKGAK